METAVSDINVDLGRLTYVKTRSKKFAALYESVKKQGILQPIILRQNEDGKFFLLKGYSRYKCATLLEMKFVPTRLVDCPDPLEARVLELEMEEDEVKFAALLNDFVNRSRDEALTIEVLSQRLNRPGSELRALTGLRRTIDSVWREIQAGNISIRSGLTLSKLPAMRQRKFLQLAQKLKTMELEEQIRLQSPKLPVQKNKSMVKAGFPLPPVPRHKEEIRRALIDPYYIEPFLSVPISRKSRQLVRETLAFAFSLDAETLKSRLTELKSRDRLQ